MPCVSSLWYVIADMQFRPFFFQDHQYLSLLRHHKANRQRHRHSQRDVHSAKEVAL